MLEQHTLDLNRVIVRRDMQRGSAVRELLVYIRTMLKQ